MNKDDKYLSSLENRLDRIEDKVDEKLDRIFTEISYINKTLSLQHVSLDEHIEGVKTLKIIVEQNKEEAERESDRLEAEIDKDEVRIRKIENDLLQKESIKSKLKSYSFTSAKVLVIIIMIYASMSGSGGEKFLTLCKAILGL